MMEIKMPTEQPEWECKRQWHEFFDQRLQQIGERAPQPILDQSPVDYIRETCRSLKHQHLPQNHPLYQVNFRGLRADALDAFVPQLLQAVVKEAVNPANFAPGEIRLVPKINPQTGMKENHCTAKNLL